MKIAILHLGGSGAALARAAAERLPFYAGEGSTALIYEPAASGGLPPQFARAFASSDGIVAIMALGIVTRMLAPLVRSKLSDPAVVAIDDQGRYAVSVLSGHEGGANRLAYWVGAATGAEPVISTGTETNKRLVAGVGCRRGVQTESVLAALAEALSRCGACKEELRLIASAAIKRDEAGLVEAARRLDLPLLFLPERSIREFQGPFARSEAAIRRVGLPAVAEPCALLAARDAKLALRRIVHSGVTVAIAREELRW
jgi:cobalt-precorrin 5A hydrolase